MPYYEIVYETGSVSVACYEDDAEALSAVKAHHDRAKTGVPALTTGATEPDRPAERVSKVFKYDSHPVDYGVGQEVSTDSVQKELQQKLKSLEHDGTVRVPDLASAVRDITSPLVEDRESRLDSMFKMEETGELDMKEWDQ